jgi:hypothetical protein
MKSTNASDSLQPPVNSLYFHSNGRRAGRLGLTELYSERLQLTNLLRLTDPGSRMHQRAKERLVEIETLDQA